MIKRYSITVKKLVYFVENFIFPVISVKSVKMNNFPLVGTRFDFKNIILVIFLTNTPNRSKLSLEKGYFVKIYNISMKQTERDSF